MFYYTESLLTGDAVSVSYVLDNEWGWGYYDKSKPLTNARGHMWRVPDTEGNAWGEGSPHVAESYGQGLAFVMITENRIHYLT